VPFSRICPKFRHSTAKTSIYVYRLFCAQFGRLARCGSRSNSAFRGVLIAIKLPVNRRNWPLYRPLDSKDCKNSKRPCMNPSTIQASHTAMDSRTRKSVSRRVTSPGQEMNDYWSSGHGASNRRCSVYTHKVGRISPTFRDVLTVDHTLSGKNGYGCTFRTNRPSECDPLTLDFYRAHIYLPSALQRRSS